MRLRVIWIGKTKSAATAEWTQEYLRRIGRYAQISHEELAGKDPEQQLLRRTEDARLVLLEPGGKSMDSNQLAQFLQEQFTHDTREMVFAIGGADGFGAELRRTRHVALSLSPLTFSHELARVMLLEQLYRACTILNHHPYHRG